MCISLGVACCECFPTIPSLYTCSLSFCLIHAFPFSGSPNLVCLVLSLCTPSLPRLYSLYLALSFSPYLLDGDFAVMGSPIGSKVPCPSRAQGSTLCGGGLSDLTQLGLGLQSLSLACWEQPSATMEPPSHTNSPSSEYQCHIIHIPTKPS